MGWQCMSAVRLLGGYDILLTLDESNEWHEYVMASSEWSERMAIDVETDRLEAKQAAGIDVSDEAAVHQARFRANLDAFFALGKRWHEEVIKPRRRNQEISWPGMPTETA